jgi:3-hydroxyisobutyrate dehydrogenase
MKIGIAGTGRMGTAIARRLLAVGHEVHAWNRTAGNAQAVLAAGASWAPTLRALVDDSQVVISFLLDNAAVERVYLGAGGLLDGAVDGRLFIDMSTVSPRTHARIATAMAQRNAGFTRSPCSSNCAGASSAWGRPAPERG